MADRRGLHLDLIAWGLLLAGLFVALAVLGHDPPSAAVYPPLPEPSNLLGPPGAWLAQELYEALGCAVHVLLASWFVLVLLLFVRKGVATWARRLAGWLLLIPCAALAADAVGPEVLGGPLAG